MSRLIFVFLLFFLSFNATAAKKVAKVIILRGKATYEAPGSKIKKPLKRGMSVPEGSKIATSQYATMDTAGTIGRSCHITINNTLTKYGYSAEL